MEKGGVVPGLLDLVRASRVDRTLFGLSAVMVPVAVSGSMNYDVFIFCICCILLYSVFGIHNGLKDRDYRLPSCTKKVLLVLGGFTVAVSLMRVPIFISQLMYLFLGYFYNTSSRKILLMDSTVLSITHYLLPVFFSALVLGLSMKQAVYLSMYFFIVSLFYMPLKNIRGAEEDKSRGYKTLPSMFRKGVQMTFMAMSVSFILMFLGYFLFDLFVIYLLFLAVIIVLGIVMVYLCHNGDIILMAKLFRFVDVFFCFAFVASSSTSMIVVTISFLLALFSFYFVLSHMIRQKHLNIKNSVNEFLSYTYKRVSYFTHFELPRLSTREDAYAKI
ncbi:hypothetical protein JXC34_01350 [Candidatus Woesearchaeota archaeon]|nr:hypothetical protein [Candidatus Woesearchaeota archaeon]